MKTLGAIMILAFAGALFAAENSSKIAGYQTGEFAVKGTVEQQLNRKVVTPLSARLAKGGEIEFFVAGSADKVGNGAENDRLAKSRADEVGAFLSEKFPDAKIVTLSKGDGMNTRSVTISWKLTKQTPAAGQPRKASDASIISLVILVIVSGFATTRVLFLRKQKREVETQEEVAPPKVTIMPKPKEIETKYAEGTWHGKTVIFPLNRQETPEGKKWGTPFTTQKDGVSNLIREDKQKAIQAVRQCLRSPYYQSEIERLIGAGVIKIKGKKEEVAS